MLQLVAYILNLINKNPRDRVDTAVMFNSAREGGVAIALGVAGSIFRKSGGQPADGRELG